MKRGLTRAGLGYGGDLNEFSRLASDYGFQSVDASGSEISQWLALDGLESVVTALSERGVEIGSIGLPVEWRASEEEFRAGLPRLAVDAEAAASVGCQTCCTYVLPSTDWNPAHFMAVATRRLRTCAQMLGAYGIRLGLEYVGPHHLRTAWKHPFIWDLPATLDWIDAIGDPHVGLLLDSYHWYTTSGSVADLRTLSAASIVHVHLNDAPDVAVADVVDDDRLYPGEGVIDLAGFLGALGATGYSGAVSQEVLTKTPPASEVNVLLERSRRGFDKVWAQAGLL